MDDYPLARLDDSLVFKAEEQEANFLVIGHREYPLHKAMRSETNNVMCIIFLQAGTEQYNNIIIIL